MNWVLKDERNVSRRYGRGEGGSTSCLHACLCSLPTGKPGFRGPDVSFQHLTDFSHCSLSRIVPGMEQAVKK